jgi:hypothetical protein
VSHHVRQIGGDVEIGRPKCGASNRVLTLDHRTTTLLRRYRDASRSPVFGEPVGFLFHTADGGMLTDIRPRQRRKPRRSPGRRPVTAGRYR